MDEKYICEKLTKLTILLYGKKCKPFTKVKKGMYVFGSKKLDITNTITKQIAIYLVIGTLPKCKKR